MCPRGERLPPTAPGLSPYTAFPLPQKGLQSESKRLRRPTLRFLCYFSVGVRLEDEGLVSTGEVAGRDCGRTLARRRVDCMYGVFIFGLGVDRQFPGPYGRH